MKSRFTVSDVPAISPGSASEAGGNASTPGSGNLPANGAAAPAVAAAEGGAQPSDVMPREERGEGVAEGVEQPSETTTGDGPRSFSLRNTGSLLRETTGKIKELWAIVSGFTLSLLGILAILAIAISLYNEVSGKSIAISDIAVPKNISDEGYSPVVVASRLRDAVETYTQQANAFGQFSSLSLAAEQPTVVLPSLGLPLDALGDTMARTFHLGGRKRVTGELIASPSDLSLRLRLNDRVIFQGTRRVKPGNDEAAEVDALLAAAVPSLLEEYAPSVEAVHLYAEEKKPELALEKARAVIDAFPPSDDNVPESYLVLGVIFTARGEFAAATDAYEAVIRQRPGGALAALAWSDLGVLDADHGKLDDAVNDEEKSEALDGTSARPHIELGVIDLKENKRREAFDENVAAVRLDPLESTPHLNLVVLYDLAGDRDRAMAEAETAVRLDPGNARTHEVLGTISYERGKLSRAAAEFQTAIGLDHRYADAYYNLGAVDFAEGKADPAATAFGEALAIDPRYPNARMSLAVLYASVGKRDRAIEQLAAELRIDPGNAVAHNDLGIDYYDEGKREEAVAEWRAAIRVDPKLPNAYQNLGAFFASTGEDDRAKRLDGRAIAADPAFAPAYYDLGILYDREGDHAKAATELRDAVRLAPNSADYHEALGTVYARARAYAAADREYRAAISLNPNDAVLHKNFAIEYDREGKHDRAAIESRYAHRLDPKLPPRDLERGIS
jgi:tetratricopeptide (TPR) repeat protein